MASVNQITGKCSKCSYSEQLSTYPLINVSSDPSLKERVKSGSLFLWQCPRCGQINLMVYETLYHDPEKKVMLWLLPPDKETAQPSGLLQRLEEITSTLPDYTFRKVEDVGSLIEKVKILDLDLEDTVIEMCKYITAMELSEKESTERRKQFLDSTFRFNGMDGPDNDLVFSFPLDGHMQSVHTGFNVYEDCAGIISRNPSVKTGEGFSLIDRSWVMKFFR